MLHAVALLAVAGSLPGLTPVQGDPAGASEHATLDEVRVGGPTTYGGAVDVRTQVAFVPVTLPDVCLSSGRLESRTPTSVAWSSGSGAAKALPEAVMTLPAGDRVIVAVGLIDLRAPGIGAHPWRPG